MDPNVSKLANSANVTERRQALRIFLSSEDWPNHKELVGLFLDDPDKMLSKEILDAVLIKCPTKFTSQLKILALSEDNSIRIKVLTYLSTLTSINNIELFIERIPLEDANLGNILRQTVVKIVEKDSIAALKPLLSSTGSANDGVRKEALGILVNFPDKLKAITELYLFMQSISPSVRDRVIESVKNHAGWFVEQTKQMLATEADANIRIQALNLLQAFKYNELEALLIEEMKQKDWALRHNVIQMLATMKSEKAKPLLIEAIDDKDLSIQAIMALDSYRQGDIGIAFLRKLGRAKDQEQIALLNGIRNVAASDKRFIEPLLVFAGHEISKVKAKSLALDVVTEICSKTKTTPPDKVAEIKKEINQQLLGNIPNLGLKLSEE